MDAGDLCKASSSLRLSSKRSSIVRADSSNIWTRNSGIEPFSRSSRQEDDEDALKWAALEKLPTFDRLRIGLLGANEVDVNNLGLHDKRNIVERLVNTVEDDNEKFLLKLRNRIDRVGIDMPTIEMRYEHLNVDAEAYGASRALPTFVNFNINIIEVTSKKDQRQYWARNDVPYRFVSVSEFAEAFQSSYNVGRRVGDELAIPFDKSKSHRAALSTQKYGVGKKELLKACVDRELLLMKRISFVYYFKIFQLTILSLIGLTMFLRTEMSKSSVAEGGVYLGALFFTVIMVIFNGMSEMAMTVYKLPVFYKHRDMYFFPAWAYAIPAWILKIPISLR